VVVEPQHVAEALRAAEWRLAVVQRRLVAVEVAAALWRPPRAVARLAAAVAEQHPHVGALRLLLAVVVVLLPRRVAAAVARLRRAVAERDANLFCYFSLVTPFSFARNPRPPVASPAARPRAPPLAFCCAFHGSSALSSWILAVGLHRLARCNSLHRRQSLSFLPPPLPHFIFASQNQHVPPSSFRFPLSFMTRAVPFLSSSSVANPIFERPFDASRTQSHTHTRAWILISVIAKRASAS